MELIKTVPKHSYGWTWHETKNIYVDIIRKKTEIDHVNENTWSLRSEETNCRLSSFLPPKLIGLSGHMSEIKDQYIVTPKERFSLFF